MMARIVGAVIVMFVAIGPVAAPNAIAGGVDVQPPCTGGMGSCLSFDSSNPSNTLRSYSFKRSKSGQAIVTFNGIIACINGNTGLVNMTVNGQIVTDANATPDYQQPGGAQITQSVAATSGLTPGAASFAFSVSRKFAYKGGTSKTVYFRAQSLFHPGGVTCNVMNATFSAVFTQ